MFFSDQCELSSLSLYLWGFSRETELIKMHVHTERKLLILRNWLKSCWGQAIVKYHFRPGLCPKSQAWLHKGILPDIFKCNLLELLKVRCKLRMDLHLSLFGWFRSLFGTDIWRITRLPFESVPCWLQSGEEEDRIQMASAAYFRWILLTGCGPFWDGSEQYANSLTSAVWLLGSDLDSAAHLLSKDIKGSVAWPPEPDPPTVIRWLLACETLLGYRAESLHKCRAPTRDAVHGTSSPNRWTGQLPVPPCVSECEPGPCRLQHPSFVEPKPRTDDTREGNVVP